jgi:hypothetical protein
MKTYQKQTPKKRKYSVSLLDTIVLLLVDLYLGLQAKKCVVKISSTEYKK